MPKGIYIHRKHTTGELRKMSETHLRLGTKPPVTPKGKRPVFNEDIREKMSQSAKKRFSVKLNHPRWRGGVTFSASYRKDLWEKNKEKYRFYALERIRRKKGAVGHHTLEEWISIKSLYDFMCISCHRREPEIRLTEDHVVPLSKGGSDWIENIQPLCVSCNSRKRTSSTDYRIQGGVM